MANGPNKYEKWYNNIIAKFVASPATDNVEVHHILPRSLGGGDYPSNLVHLTAKAHFLCHLLLFKMHTGEAKAKMATALLFMMTTRNKQLTSRTYSAAKRSNVEHMRRALKGRVFTEETRRKMSVAAKKRFANRIQTGSDNPMFSGLYITPWGEFETSTEAASASPRENMNFKTIQRACRHNNTKRITKHTLKRSVLFDVSHVGKTPAEVGYGFRVI